MSAKSSRIPVPLPEFDKYFHNAVNYIGSGGPPVNGLRLGLTAADIAQAQAYFAQWYTGNPAAPGVYELHANRNTKSHTTRMQVVTIQKDFSAFFRPRLNIMASSPLITAADRTVLNIAAPSVKKSKKQVSIADSVFTSAKPIGGGDMRLYFKNQSSNKRAGKPHGVDIVQLAYKLGDPAPASPADAGLIIFNSSKALFTMHLGPASSGLRFHLYARWFNTKYPNLAGPWSGLFSVMIA
jgi:hypothetical protein